MNIFEKTYLNIILEDSTSNILEKELKDGLKIDFFDDGIDKNIIKILQDLDLKKAEGKNLKNTLIGICSKFKEFIRRCNELEIDTKSDNKNKEKKDKEKLEEFEVDVK